MQQRLPRADPALMRQINAVTTLRTLYDAAGSTMTLTELVEATRLARKTAEAAVERLVADQLVDEVAPNGADRAVGRPARAFRFRPGTGYVVGIDINVHHVSALLSNLTGEVLARSGQQIARNVGRDERIGSAVAAFRRCCTDAGVAATDVWSTTVGTPGLVDASDHVSLCHVMPEWSDFSPARELASVIPGDIHVENDTNLSAVAEHWQGAAVGVDHLVWVLIGRRFSSALLVDGTVYRGANGAAGEIGWSPELGWETLNEQQLSFTGAPSTRAGEVAADIVARAVAGHDDARHDIDAFARSLAPGLTALVHAFDPQRLVIGGGIASAGQTLLEALDRHMRPQCLTLPELRTSALGGDSVALGALRHSMNRVESSLFSFQSSPTEPRNAHMYRR